MKRLTLILKNNYLFFISICIIQTLVDYFRSGFLEKMIGSFRLGRWKVLVILFCSFFIVTATEIFPNYIASKENSKILILNDFLLNIASSITLIFSPLKFLLKERKKFFTYNEEDFVRFVNNLTSKEILLLEPSEAKLVSLAFNIDDKDITSLMTPLEKTFYLSSSMQTEEVIKFCLQRSFTKYPVFNDNRKKVVGIFNTKNLILPLLRGEKITNWKSYINKKTIFLDHKTKLSTALENMKGSRSYLAFARNGKKIIGIITLRDILSSLVGKIHDETT